MKWMVLYNVSNSDFFANMSDLLTQHDISVVNGAESFFVRDFSKKDIVAAFNDVFAVVILDSFKLWNENDSGFLSGYLAGKNIPIFIARTGKEELIAHDLKRTVRSELLFVFSSQDEMFRAMPERLAGFVKKERVDSAFRTLFNQGMPFMPDNLAFYVAKDKIRECNLYLEAGMGVNSRTSSGVPMLNVAVRNECVKMARWLVDKGADINQVALDRGYSALMDAVWKNNAELVKFFIERGARIDFISKEGQSILVLAVGIGNPKICRLLVEYGADCEHKDGMGMSAADYARLFHKDEIVSIFEERK